MRFFPEIDLSSELKLRDGKRVKIDIDGDIYYGEVVYRGSNLETNTADFEIKDIKPEANE